MKKITVLVSLMGLLFTGVVFGQTSDEVVASNVQAVQVVEGTTMSDLGVTDPGLLPTNPFYFLKELGRNVQRVFAFDPVSKAELELKITNEKAAEVKKIQEIVPNDNAAIVKGIENYRNAQENLRNKLELLNTSSTTPAIDKLLTSVANNTILHQKVLDEIGFKASDSVDVRNIVNLAKEKIDASVVAAAKENPGDFINKLENAFVEAKGSELKYIRSLEIINRLESKVPEEAADSLNRLREYFSSQLNENIKNTIESSSSEIVQQALIEIPGDAVRKAVIIDEMRASADPSILPALDYISENLKKEYESDQDLAIIAERQLKLVKELLKKLEDKLISAKNGVEAKSNIEIAKNHIQKADSSFIDKKYGEVIGQTRSAEAIIKKSFSLIEEKSTNLDYLRQQLKELSSKINNYTELLVNKKITAESNPKIYENLSLAKKFLIEAEKYASANDVNNAKINITEARRVLENILRIFEQTNNVQVIAPIKSIEITGISGAISISSCDSLKKEMENILAMLRSGIIKEEDYKIKYENLKQQLEKCLNGVQVNTNAGVVEKPLFQTSTSTPIYFCDSLKESLNYLEKMLASGLIKEADYKIKYENIQIELRKCSGVSIPPLNTINPPQQNYCTMDYNPVCAQPPMPKCSDGLACIQVMPPLKTYSNECVAKNSGAIIKYKGECGSSENLQLPTTNTETFIKPECGQENERLNRDPLLGPVNKPCCFGLKEDRSNISYSICIKSEVINTDMATSTSNVISCPALAPISPDAERECNSKGGKMIVKQDAAGCKMPPVCVLPAPTSTNLYNY